MTTFNTYFFPFFQEQLRKRREEEEKIAAQNEFLRASIRGSRKLQSLQQEPPTINPTGFDNIAYTADEEEPEEKIHGMYLLRKRLLKLL